MTSPARRYTAVSLFSGCGGFCEGVRLAGFDVKAAVEWDRFAAETYRHNFPDVPLFEDDIHEFVNQRSAVWRDCQDLYPGVAQGEVDLVFGGPPCQGYSQIGTRDLDDPRNGLYSEFVRVLKYLRPRIFLMENVPNMLLLNKGIFKEQALASFRRAGYHNVDVRVVAAADFGVPQLRRRAIFVGIRDDLVLGWPVGAWTDAVLKELRQPHETVWQAIGDLPETVSPGPPLPYPSEHERSWISDELRLDTNGTLYSSGYKVTRAGGLQLHNHHTKEIQERRRRLIAQLAPGTKGNTLPPDVWNGLRPEKWRRLHPDRPAYTILAQMHRDLSEWVHPRYERWITVREAARLQTFHDGFLFKSSEWQMLKQIGNAVPPLLGRAVGGVAVRALEAIDGSEAASSLVRPIEELELQLAL